MTQANPFVRDAGVEKPGIVGARWWNKSLNESSSLPGRRGALTAVIVGAGVVLMGAFMLAGRSCGEDDEFREEARKSLQLQRDYGWNFGATSETVAFDQQYTQTYARSALATLASDLAPSSAEWAPQFVQTLFESPEAVPRLTLSDGETSRVRPLAEALKPIHTPTMVEQENRGRAYADLISQSEEKVLTIVDLPGPDAVAFASGAASVLDPIFLFDNWPHPRGVVPSHLTLAAAVYYQPAFARAKLKRATTAWPMAVIDSARLNLYHDDSKQFDNRYMAKLTAPVPGSIKRVMYIYAVDGVGMHEMNDFNAAFMKWQGAGAEVRALAAAAFHPKSKGSSEYIFGANQAEHDSFFAHYPWKKPTPRTQIVESNFFAAGYRPAAREAPDANRIGLAPVVLAVGTGLLLGSKLNRNGSWNRSSGGYGG